MHRILACSWLLAALASPRAEKAPQIVHRPLLVGYFPQWGVYAHPAYHVKDMVRSGAAALLDQLDYAQGAVRNDRCAVADPNADLNVTFSAADSVDGVADDAAQPLRGNFHQLQELKRRYPKLRILISLEGKAGRFASAAKPAHRAAFVSSCVNLFLRGGFAPGGEGIFDGIDIDWEYPKLRERANAVALVDEFRRQMDALRPGLVLSVTGPAGREHYDQMDLAAIAQAADLVGVMNYDYNGPWSGDTGLLAPLFDVNGDPTPDNTVDATIRGYLAAGVPAEKLLMGIPFYAYRWDRVKDENHGLFQHGKKVKEDQPYHYIESIEGHFSQYRDEHSQAPWLYDGVSFWTYDDAVSIRKKMEYERGLQLGGVMVWELSGDTEDGALLRSIASSWGR